jgi:hypothetical protein
MIKSKSMIKIVTGLIVLAAAVPVLMALDAGEAKFVTTKDFFISGTEIKAGQYDIRWEATGQDVAFVPAGKTEGIKIQCKVEQVDKKSDFNSMMSGKDSAGRETLRQIQFRGKNVRLQFE